MSHTNAWTNPSLAGPEDAARMAAFLEERSQLVDQMQLNQVLVDILEPQAGERLLEVGSGTGVLCRLVTTGVTSGGCVVGLDISYDFAAFAERTAGGQSVSPLHYLVGRGQRLPFQDASFDGVWAARLLLHAEDPQTVVDEMVRVVRPGGRVILADWDFETVTVDHPDRELTRRILHWRTDHHGGDNWSGRKLLRRARNAGLDHIECIPFSHIAVDESSALTLSLWRAAEVARDGGEITHQEHDGWVTGLKECIHQKRFFASIVYFILKGWT
jgi:ubiquinone/menaquinone biosynthesis C-methylase UbiE